MRNNKVTAGRVCKQEKPLSIYEIVLIYETLSAVFGILLNPLTTSWTRSLSLFLKAIREYGSFFHAMFKSISHYVYDLLRKILLRYSGLRSELSFKQMSFQVLSSSGCH